MQRFLIVFILLSFICVMAQQQTGGFGNRENTGPVILSSEAKQSDLKIEEGFVYSTTTFTFDDLVVFSYFDQSKFVVFDNTGTAVDSVVLNKDDFYTFRPGSGTYRIDCNNSFTLLIGDPISRSVMGFFAVDESGSPLSTHINTYMPAEDWGEERLVVFAYENGTEVFVRNLSDSSTVAAGVLDRGEHMEITNVTSTFIGVKASKPVSVLSYADQGYYVPADNGSFAGTKFYGFSGYIGSWTNGVVVTAYEEGTSCLILNSETGDTLLTDSLDYGETAALEVNENLYWEVQTNKKVTVNNTPYAGWSNQYYHLVRQMDASGEGIGKHFLAPCIPGDFDLYSFGDNNAVTIVDLSTNDTTAQLMLNKGEHYHLSPSKTVYEVKGSENLSIITSWGGSYGADFVALDFAVELPDLAISAIDIDFDPDSVSTTPGTPFTINATVHNYGFKTAKNVTLQFYDGEPSANNNISSVFTVDSIPAGGEETLSVNWETPSYPEYHAVYVTVDQRNTVVESNESNNVASRFLIPNDDLLPPLSTVVNAPSKVTYNGDSLSFDAFTLETEIFNNGDVDATNAFAELHLPPEWSLMDMADSSQTFGDIPTRTTVKHSWKVYIESMPQSSMAKVSNQDDTEAYFYSITVGADNAEIKEVERMLLFEDSTAVGIDDAFTEQMPSDFSISQNYPNPFNPTTRIDYRLHKAGQVRLDVYDVNGRRVAELTNARRTAGYHSVTFKGDDLSSGVYFVRFNVNGKDISVIRMTLIK